MNTSLWRGEAPPTLSPSMLTVMMLLVRHLLEADAGGLHQEQAGIVGQAQRDVAGDVIALALVREHAARVGEQLLQPLHAVSPQWRANAEREAISRAASGVIDLSSMKQADARRQHRQTAQDEDHVERRVDIDQVTREGWPEIAPMRATANAAPVAVERMNVG